MSRDVASMLQREAYAALLTHIKPQNCERLEAGRKREFVCYKTENIPAILWFAQLGPRKNCRSTPENANREHGQVCARLTKSTIDRKGTRSDSVIIIDKMEHNESLY